MQTAPEPMELLAAWWGSWLLRPPAGVGAAGRGCGLQQLLWAARAFGHDSNICSQRKRARVNVNTSAVALYCSTLVPGRW
jgi:hypothetical protein